MLKHLEQIIAGLADTNAGWVVRRDAAEALGKIASEAIAALTAHANDKDVDVRSSVNRALKHIGVPFTQPAGAPPSDQSLSTESAASPAPPTMKALAVACTKKPKRAVKAEGNGFVVRVKLKDERMQYVHVARHTRDDGRDLIRVSTECGPADPESIAWAIRNNSQCIYCAFNVDDRDGVDHLTIVSNFDPKHLTPAMIKDAVKEMAFYGDWLEKKLTGEDEH